MSAVQIEKLRNFDYGLGLKKKFLITLSLFCFFLSLFIFFPFEEKIKSILQKNINKVAAGCAFTYDDFNLGLFLPKIVFQNIHLPAGCGGLSAPLNLEYLNLNFRGPSFSPVGLAFEIELGIDKNPLSFYLSLGPSSIAFNLQNSNFDLNSLTTLMPQMPKVSGTLDLNLHFEYADDMIQDLKINSESKNFYIPFQEIKNAKIPDLKIDKFALRVQTDSPQKIKVEEIILGDLRSPIRAKFKGEIKPLKNAFSFSPINLKGEIAFSKEFIDSFAIVNLLLQSYTQKDGFYQMNIGGTLSSLEPRP